MPCTNTFFLCLPVRHFAKSFQILLAPINLLLQELLKSNAQTSNDTKQGQKEESLTEARRADLINQEVWLDWRPRWCLTHLCAGWRRWSSQSLLRNLKSFEAQNLSQTRSSGRRKSPSCLTSLHRQTFMFVPDQFLFSSFQSSVIYSSWHD